MIKRVLPFLGWFEGYKPAHFRADMIAGITVALVLIPQSMAYAQLAGLPAYFGLYAAFLPPMVAALFGSSRQLATGPVAVVSLMTAASLGPLATSGTEGYIAYALFLALLVGIFQISLGILRLGVLVNFLSHPVILGFTNAAAIIIATSQLSKIFGVSVDKATHHYETVWRVVIAAIHFTHWPTFLLALLAFAIMYGIKRISPRLPFVLTAVAITTLISWSLGLEDSRKVDISTIESPEVHDLINTFNKDIQDANLMAEAKTALLLDTEQVHGAEDVCSHCHVRQRVTMEMLRSDATRQESISILPKTALMLHSMAGLLDKQLATLRKKVATDREKLRRLHFIATEHDGIIRFHTTESKNTERADGPIWRLKVGDSALDTKSLSMLVGGEVVGAIPAGLPSFKLPTWDWKVLGDLFMAAIIISILGFMEAISIAKAMAARTGQRLDPNQELIGQGIANIVGSFGQSYAVSGSFSRSAVNIQAGAVTGLSSVFTSVVVVLVLLFMTPLLYHLPQSVLASVIMMAVIGLVNIKGIVHSWRVQPSDGIISVITFAATLVFAPHLDRGILVGVALSVGVFLYRKMKPAITDLSLWTDGLLRDSKYHGLKHCKHIAVIRFEGPLFFANSSYLEDEVLSRIRQMPELKYFAFCAEGINHLDSSAEETLSLLVDRLRSGGYDVFFCSLSENIMDIMRRSHLLEKIGEDHFFPSSFLLVDAIWEKAHEGSDEEDCPLRKVIPIMGKPEEYRISVLLIDDEQDFVKYTARRLEARGLRAKGMFDGKSALELLEKQSFDVIILDVAMPGMSGIEVFNEIRKRDPDQPVIMLTGHGTIEDAVESMRKGAVDYLQKPCDFDELLEKIQMVYSTRSC